MAYIIVGNKKLEIKFLIAFISYFATFILSHMITLRPGIEAYIFYIVGVYNVVIYISISFSNPGWLDEKQKNQINRLVSTILTFSIVT